MEKISYDHSNIYTNQPIEYTLNPSQSISFQNIPQTKDQNQNVIYGKQSLSEFAENNSSPIIYDRIEKPIIMPPVYVNSSKSHPFIEQQIISDTNDNNLVVQEQLYNDYNNNNNIYYSPIETNNNNEIYYDNNEINYDNNEIYDNSKIINYQEIIPNNNNFDNINNEEYINYQDPLYYSQNNISVKNNFYEDYVPSYNFRPRQVFIPEKDFINEPVRKVYAKNLSKYHFKRNDYWLLYNEKNKKAMSIRMRDSLRDSRNGSEFSLNKRSTAKRNNSSIRSYSSNHY